MRSEFDVSFFNTPTPQQSQSHKNSKTHIEFISRRPVLEIPDELDNANKQAVVMEQKQEDVANPPPSSSSSSSSASKNQTNKGEEKQREAMVAKDDDGYQTPTSARHRILPATKCPSAPKKPAMPKLWHCIKIKAPTGRVRRRIEVGSALCPETDELDQKKKKKKARGDGTANP